MSGRRNIIIAVGAIVLLAAAVGFYITLDVSPQIAYARLFIDIGLCIGLVAVILALYREPTLATEPIIQAIKSLKAGKYKTRLTVPEGALFEIGSALNELAKNLELQYNKQEEIKRNLREELLPSMKLPKEQAHSFDHSFHPELGPVCSVRALDFKSETKFQNALVESKPPAAPSFAKLDIELEQELELEQQELEPEQENSQDLGELYQRFVDAQQEINMRQIEYAVFLKTIEQSRTELKKSHMCREVLFDIVKEPDQIALQPRIIR